MFGLNANLLDINGAFNLNTEIYMKMTEAELLGLNDTGDFYPRGIMVDGTIGHAGKTGLQGPEYEIGAELGKQQGANLFHSFWQFNLLAGESATFSGPDSVKNIISRITGGSPSWINGRILSSIPDADFYFLNSYGVMFGLYATLSLGGSFHVSTADYLKMGDAERFYSMPMANEVLSVAAPKDFGFLSDYPVKISSKYANLEVSEGKDISLIGGAIELRNTTLTVPKGRVFIKGQGNVDILSDSGIQQEGGGSIVIRAERFTMENSNFSVHASDDNNSLIDIDADNISVKNSFIQTQPSETGKGGDLIFNAKESVLLSDETNINTQTQSSKDAGNFQVTANRISVEKSYISTSTSGAGHGGDVLLSAEDSVFCSDSTFFSSSLSAGNAGNIRIRANMMDIKHSNLLSSTSGSGHGGDVSLDAQESVLLSDQAFINSQTNGTDENAGNSGNVSMTAKDISFTKGANITTSTYNTGHGGDVTITASGTVSIKGDTSGISTNTSNFTESDVGAGGNITVTAQTLNLSEKARIDASSFRGGKAGKIILNAADIYMDNESRIISESPLKNAYSGFATIQDRDDNVLIAGDTIVIQNSYNGKSSNLYYTGKGPLPLKIYHIADMSELNRLSTQGIIAFGDVAKVADAGNGTPGTFICSDPSTSGWVRFDENKTTIVANSKDLTAINYQFYPNAQDVPYSLGDVIRVADTENGKTGLYVYTYSKAEWGAFSNIIRLSHFTVENSGELSSFTQKYSVSDGDTIFIKDSKSEFVFNNNRWIKLRDNTHTISDWQEYGKLIFVNAGNVTTVKDSGAGNAQAFIYSGNDWITLNDSYSVAALSEINSVPSQTGNVVYVADDGTGKSAQFMNADGQWLKIPKGDSGTIEINADSLIMKNNSKISSNTHGNGDATDIAVNVKRLEADSGSHISSESDSEYFGGDTGKIIIHADESVKLFGNSYLTTNGTDSGGGKVSVYVNDLLYLHNSDITSSVKQGVGNGGDVDISSKFVILNQGNIRANAGDGDGGAVFIRSENFLKSAQSVVEASSARGNQGTVNIDAPDLNLSGSLIFLPGNFFDVSRWASTPCEARSDEPESRFEVRTHILHPVPFGELP